MKKLKLVDYYVLIPYIVLSFIGIVMVYSASTNVAASTGTTAAAYLIKQSAYVVVGLVLAFIFFRMRLSILRNWRVVTFATGGILFLVLFVLVFGARVNGAKGWINLGPVNIQPEEFLKLYIVLFLAHYMDSHQFSIETHYWRTMRGALALLAVLVGCILIQPDTGGAAIDICIILIMALASGNKHNVPMEILTGLFVAYIGMLSILSHVDLTHSFFGKSYQIQRFVAFVDPFGTIKTVGRQLVNSYYAISNGGLFGVGLGNSIQKMGYLPEPNTDFILAVTSEELGAIAVLGILLLIGTLAFRAIRLGNRAETAYESLMCYGIATLLTVQTLFNVGGVVGALPITGVTLPFISYGGSSMLVLSMCMGLLLNVSAREKRARTA
ncbi:FtsW/RodA/SpoVE family cell cycle protein [Furfurilactobacillus siliginis]|uniref:Probable peptidoglycan glycosyltransferase FtsW n=1 Tax=Furfurilactobacillus siliginis TaxID=348151 RepID=A0A0R2KZK6_9LACO|nr:FtsW/RodA/SpoVE family cell cycle protein [Furfurilactobacillus siliginis]KRN94866.1 cell division membrane protein [Furfurilactobacillus siliginis]GEK28437.1 cell division protein FtsW [Furfurilactobacillus siliginis]